MNDTGAVTRRIVAAVMLLCLAASTAEAVMAQVRTARSHAMDPSGSPGVVVPGQDGPEDVSVRARAEDPGDRRLHHHRDDHEHDPAGEHCVHHHVVGPTADRGCDVTVGLTSDLRLPSPGSPPADRTSPPSPEPPRA